MAIIKKALKFFGWTTLFIVGFFFLVIVPVANNHKEYSKKFAQENLYKEGSIYNFVSNELSIIATGQLIYFIEVGGGESLNSEMKDPGRKDLGYFAKSDGFDGPEHLKDNGSWTNAHVNTGISVKNNACVIRLRSKNIDKSASLTKRYGEKMLAIILVHEAVHCGQGAALSKIKGDFHKAVKSAQNGVGLSHEDSEILNKSQIVFLESFVGAYFLSNSKHPGKSILLDAVAEDGWRNELSNSTWRGYAMTFAAIAKRCHDASRCSADLDKLNAQLVNDPDIMRAVVLDAMAIIKKTTALAQAK